MPPSKQPLDKPTILYGLALAGAGAASVVWAFSRPVSGGDSLLFGILGFLYLTVGASALGMSLESPPTGAARYALFGGVLLAPFLGAHCVSASTLHPDKVLGAYLALALAEAGALFPIAKPLWDDLLKFLTPAPAAGPLPDLDHHAPLPQLPPRPDLDEKLDGPKLLATGSFKVDRTRALQKLQQFQLVDPDAFLLPWIRCAVASGAKDLQLLEIPGGIEMRFDGAPFTREELAEPYEAIFSAEGETGERARHFAMGLLGALRTGPAQIAVYAGRGPEAPRLIINDPEASLRELNSPPDWSTVARVRWAGLTAGRRAASILSKAREGWGPADANLMIEKIRVSHLPADNGRTIRRFLWKNLPACVLVPWEEGAREGRVKLYKLGALAAELQIPDLPAEGRIADDSFTLSLSQAGVVHDDLVKSALQRVREEAKSLPTVYEASARGLRASDWTGIALLAASLGLTWLLIF